MTGFAFLLGWKIGITARLALGNCTMTITAFDLGLYHMQPMREFLVASQLLAKNSRRNYRNNYCKDPHLDQSLFLPKEFHDVPFGRELFTEKSFESRK